MVDSSHRPHRDRSSAPTATYPFCGTQVAQQYPRHRITLEDEADTVSTRIVNRRLCAECWDALYPVLAETATSHL